MSKALIIAEKPSVATDLQRVLAQPAYGGKFTKEKDYFENEKLIISSAIYSWPDSVSSIWRCFSSMV